MGRFGPLLGRRLLARAYFDGGSRISATAPAIKATASGMYVDALRAAGSEPTVRVVAYDDRPSTDARIAEVACQLRALGANSSYRGADVSLDRVSSVSARALAGQLAGLFDHVAA